MSYVWHSAEPFPSNPPTLTTRLGYRPIMTRGRFSTSLCAFTLATIALGITPSVANADPADDQFTQATQSVQGEPAQLIQLARNLCAAADLPRVGLVVPPYAEAMWAIRGQLSAMGNSQDQLRQFAQAANAAYCPDKQLL
jgi:hypothetical protein